MNQGKEIEDQDIEPLMNDYIKLYWEHENVVKALDIKFDDNKIENPA